jgi:hypothetical protein
MPHSFFSRCPVIYWLSVVPYCISILRLFPMIWISNHSLFAFPWLVKGLNVGRCLIYMPRIDLWAVDKVHEQETEDHGLNAGTSKLSSSPIGSMTKCSEVWNTLVDQMDSLLASVSISVLVSFICTLHGICLFNPFLLVLFWICMYIHSILFWWVLLKYVWIVHLLSISSDFWFYWLVY